MNDEDDETEGGTILSVCFGRMQVVIAKTVPNLQNLSHGSSGGVAAAAPRPAAAPGGRGLDQISPGGVSVPRTQSMYTYRVPSAYLPVDSRHLFITVLMVSPGEGVDLKMYRRYKLVAIIGDCRFFDEEEVDKSPSCKVSHYTCAIFSQRPSARRLSRSCRMVRSLEQHRVFLVNESS